MTEKRGTRKKADRAPMPPDRQEAGNREAVMASLNERIASLEHELHATREELQSRQEEMEVQAEELESHLDELNRTNEVLENEVQVRKQSEDALRKSQFILAKSQEMAHVGNWAWNLQTGEMSWSDESFRIFGLPPGETRPHRELLLSLVHPDDRGQLSDIAAAICRSGEKAEADVRVQMPDGSLKYVNAIADKIVRDKCGQASRIYGIFQDISERKLVEIALHDKMEEIEVQNEEIEVQNEELRANNEELEKLARTLQQREVELSRLAAIVTSSDDAIIGKTLDGIITSWNAGAERMYGYAAGEAIGRSIDIVVPPEHIAEAHEILDKIRLGQRVYHQVTRRVARDGGLIDMSITVSPIVDPAGNVIGASTIARDITERLQTEVELRKLSRAVEESPAMIVVTDVRGNIEYVNPMFTRVTGYSYEEAIGKNPRIPKSGNTTAAEYKRLWDTVLSGREWRGEFLNRKKNGELYWEMALIAPIKDQEGRITSIIAVKEDITDRKKAEEELKEAKQQAELYLDLMGHDISNMHQIALSQLELAHEIMREEGRLEGNEIEMISTPIETLQRSARLIDNVSKLQKLRAGEYRMEIVDVGRVLGEVVKEHSVDGNGITINYIPVQGCLAKANPLIKEAFTNLVGNAIKHSDGATVINIGVSRVSESGSLYHRIAIDDTGPGIPDDKKDEIFHRFKRGQTKARGTGLGLYIVKTLVESFNGRVEVEDRMPGDHTSGSKFIVYLPVVEDLHE